MHEAPVAPESRGRLAGDPPISVVVLERRPHHLPGCGGQELLRVERLIPFQKIVHGRIHRPGGVGLLHVDRRGILQRATLAGIP